MFWSFVAAVLFAILLGSLITGFWAYKRGHQRLKWGCGLVSTGILSLLGLMFIGGIFFMYSVLDVGAFRLTPPEIGTLQGTYVLSDASRHRLAAEKSYSSVPESKIELTSTGEIVCASLPDCLWDGFGRAGGHFYSCKGNYEIAPEMTHYYNISIKSSESMDPQFDGIQFRIMRDNELRATIGDPDSDDYLYFIKKN
jgi:hypothetical protein